ncbi:response regulator transcription factor [Mesorhizobium sp. INR15]|uniref:response regulator transcription factor n=1 Tax=Mesorhizobium sp. INR15 TaxID=2654248 RepID=UPI001896413D|nr:helix-turn-helix transcriptional regulator [Mesorhizobium sp. INR15]QPC93666.1 LuxR family transcriptional regulator [Mesorhizobium sp. INR15]
MQLSLSAGQFERWSVAIATAASAQTPQHLAASVSAGARELFASDRVYVGLYNRGTAPMTIDEGGPDRWNRAYDALSYKHDPFFQLFTRSADDFLLPLTSLATDDFERSRYYREFYDPSESCDEITGVFNLDASTAGFITYWRRRGAPPFGEAELSIAKAANPATRMLLGRLWHLLGRDGHRITAISDFSALSARETEITRLLLAGGCAKSIARRLAISSGTVRNHIKSIYGKLGVHSQVELMALRAPAIVAPRLVS